LALGVATGCATSKLTCNVQPPKVPESYEHRFLLSDPKMQEVACRLYPGLFRQDYSCTDLVEVVCSFAAGERPQDPDAQYGPAALGGLTLFAIPVAFVRTRWTNTVTVTADSLLGPRLIGTAPVAFAEYYWLSVTTPLGLLVPPGPIRGKTWIERMPAMLYPAYRNVETEAAIHAAVDMLLHYPRLQHLAQEQTIMRGNPISNREIGSIEAAIVTDLDSRSLPTTETAALTETLRADVFKTGYFVLLSKADMQKVIEEQKFSVSEHCSSAECLIEMGRLMAASFAIGGTVEQDVSGIFIELRIVDVRSQRSLATAETHLQTDSPLQEEALMKVLRYVGGALLKNYALVRAKTGRSN